MKCQEGLTIDLFLFVQLILTFITGFQHKLVYTKKINSGELELHRLTMRRIITTYGYKHKLGVQSYCAQVQIGANSTEFCSIGF